MFKKSKLNKIVIDINNDIGKVINILNFHSSRLVIITKNKKYLGVINDGDLRRGFLKGYTIKDKISKIVNTNSIKVSPHTSTKEVIEIMKRNKCFQIPIVDRNKKVAGIHTIDELLFNNLNKSYFLVMAGGFGKRLKPLTDKIPKPMIKFNGKPMLEIIIEKAINEGFKKFIISTYYKSNFIKNYFGNGNKHNIEIEYLNEKKPLGTAGSLGLLKIPNNTNIIVSNCDVVSDVSYSNLLDYHIKNKAQATMAVKYHEFINPFGVANILDGKIISLEEKPVSKSYVNIGVYAFNSNVFKNIKTNQQIDMPEFYSLLIKKKLNIQAYPIHEKWLDLGAKKNIES